MLIGQFSSRVGEKGRIAVPKRFRQTLGERIIVTYGFESSLIVVSEANWRSLLEGTEDKPFLMANARDTQRFLLGGASLAELDSQGRFVLPDYLRRFAEIKAEAVFVGLNKYAEIWDSERWAEYQVKIKKNIANVAENLVKEIGKS